MSISRFEDETGTASQLAVKRQTSSESARVKNANRFCQPAKAFQV